MADDNNNPQQPQGLAPRPPSRMERFEGYLTNFIGALGAGMANAGTGPGANVRGAGAALSFPFQRQAQIQQLQQQQQLNQAQTEEAKSRAGLYGAQAQQMQNTVPVTLGNGQTAYVPQGKIGDIIKAQIGAQAKTDVAKTAKRFMSVPGVGLVDTQDPAGPKVIPGTTNGVTINEEHLKDYNLPPEFLGKQMTLQQLSGLERAQNTGVATVQGAQGPALVNKRTGATKSLGLGNPGVATASARAGMTPVTIPDPDNPGGFKTVSALDAIRSGATTVTKPNGTQVMAKQALIDDIKGGIGQLKSSASVLDNNSSKLKIAAAMAEPGLTSQTFLQSPILNTMNDAEQNYTVQLLSLREQAMAMRSVLGAGQGSEDLRQAILKTVPNASTPNSKFAIKQLDQFATTLDRLSKGVPKLGRPTAAAPVGVIRFQANGKTYNIPAAQKDAFLKDNPAARLIQ